MNVKQEKKMKIPSHNISRSVLSLLADDCNLPSFNGAYPHHLMTSVGYGSSEVRFRALVFRDEPEVRGSVLTGKP